MKFEKICVINIPSFSKEQLKWVQKYSNSKISYLKGDSGTPTKTAKLIGSSDCILASREVTLGADLLSKCKMLKYVGIYGTGLSKVDLEAAKTKGITVTNVPQYCNFDVAEFIVAELLQKARGLGKVCWKKAPCSLQGKKLGIVGLGKVGKNLARLSQAHGMEVSYFDLTRNSDFEKQGVRYLEMNDLLTESEIVSVQVPRDARIFSKREFKLMKEGTLLMSTSQGRAFELVDFGSWIKNPHNVALFDSVGGESYLRFKHLKNVSISPKAAYITTESMDRLTASFFQNIEKYLNDT